MADERNVEVPDSWLDVARKHRVAVSVAAVLLAAAGMSAAWYANRNVAERTRGASLEDLPADGAGSGVATATGDATGSADATGMASQDGSGGTASGHATIDPAKKAEPAPAVAYRTDGMVWVSRENGSDAKAVTGMDVGSYALSVDGRTLAFIDTSGKTAIVAFADVDTGEITKSATVTDFPTTPIAWLAGDSAVVCVKDDMHLARVPVSGAAEELIPVAGERTVFGTSPNGAILAYLGPDASTLTLRYPDASTRALPLADVSAVAVGYDRLFVSYLGSARIESMRLDGTERQQIIGAPESGLGSAWEGLAVSPDGTRLAFSELFNDGYSRLYTVKPDGKAMKPLWVRRDTYFVRWLADSSGVVFVEGNEWQGEPTTLMRANADGTGRRPVVEGAGL